MKAILVEEFGEPSVLKLKELPDLKPGHGEVLVGVKAVGVNPYETYIRAGVYARKPSLPFIPGADAAGVVEAVGPGVNRFKAGDRVYTFGVNGAYAQQLLAKETNLQLLPANTSFAQGAALAVPYGTAHYGLFHRGQAKAGETVLIHGASGAVGIGAIQMARAAGMTVFGTAGSEAGLKAVAEQGAQAFDHRQAGYFDKILAATGGKGLDLILEMLANVNLAQDLKGLAMRGRVVIIGSRGPIEIDPRDTMGRNADIRGLTLFNAAPADLQVIHQDIHDGLAKGRLRPIIAAELPLASAAQAHLDVMKNGKIGKIVLIP